MYKQKSGFLVGFLLLFISLQAEAGSVGKKETSDWELARSEDEIFIFYRWITLDSLKTREMRAQFTIDADVDKILHQFSDADNYHSWAAGIKECRIESVSDSCWIVHNLMNYPWPFKKKDMVARCKVSRNGAETTLIILAEPKFFPEKQGIERIQNFKGEWRFVSQENGNTFVDYRVVSYTRPALPRVIQDPVIQRLFIDSFQDLKQLAETN